MNQFENLRGIIILMLSLFLLFNVGFAQTIKEITAVESYEFFKNDGLEAWKNFDFDLVAVRSQEGIKQESGASHVLLPELKPIVQVFGTALYNIESNLYQYSFGRTHLGLQYQFNQNWSAKIIIDRGRATSTGTITVSDSSGQLMHVQNTATEGAYYTMFLKFASLQWKVNDKLALEGGAILQNHYNTQERFWGLRYVAQTFQDLYWKIPSSDLGFMATYKINKFVSFDASLTNGEGPRVKQDAYGKVKFAGGIDIIPSPKIQTRLYYHNRKSGLDSLKTENMFSAFVGYKLSDYFRLGGEFNYMHNLNNTSNLDSYGISFYSTYQILEDIQLFARYDQLVYDTDSSDFFPIPGDGNTLMGGLSYSPLQGISLSLNYQAWLPGYEHSKHENNILFSMEFKF